MLTADNDFILIVDDNPTNLSVLAQALKASGFKVRVAADGETALAIASQHHPAIILLDVQMPGIDGFETCQRLKADQRTDMIPIIFMTALADTEHKVKGLSIGAVDYITKPFEETEVISRVNVHLKLRHLTRELETKNQQLQEFNQNLEHQVHLKTETLRQTQSQLVQREKLSALGELVTGIAHEINNPIGCIINNIDPAQSYIANMTQALQLYRANGEQITPAVLAEIERLDLDFILEDLPKIFKTIELSGNRIHDIAISLRNFARADIHTQQVTNIREGLDGTLLILGHRLKAIADKPPIQVHTHYGGTPQIACYPGQLNQVFMNLMANAIDALEEAIAQNQLSNPEIHLTTELDNQAIVVRIADNGPGIPPPIQTQLFDPMFTTKPVGKGTGLGLSISRQIIEELHQGSIQINPAVKQGAEFIIRLPLTT
ncbi:response regulator [filamentous cyanobacterium LEGE 11480]|uniref:histidine kinase n=1 Tax=Romeriopsis navalis LEGE 11480 TaxID=2777977 RepID=A0A928VSA5_9CYAN|nr:response regulator [Romeriopsis navalis]MBE9031274.1 response regulator [Romeriopsis navalis LEGE 11480]